MGEMKHTPEPWITCGNDRQIAGASSDQWNNGYYFAECPGPDGVKNADRIVACVNACVGMKDPAQEIATLKQQRDILLESLESTTKWMNELKESGDAGFWHWHEGSDYNKAIDVIAKIKATL